ncbi:MAG: hypothetical protein ACOC1K_06590 [Nanoarchaeota archaeon]
MSLISTRDVMNEFIYFLRNNLTDPENRGDDATENFTASTDQTDFSLDNNPVFNITNVTVNGDNKDFGKDYTLSFTYNSCTLSFNSGLNENDNVEISYHYNDSWVKLGKLRTDFEVTDYPAIIVTEITKSNEVLGIGLEGLGSDFAFRVYVLYKNYSPCKDMMETIVQEFWDNRKGFYYVTGVIPVNEAGPGIDPTRKNEIHIGDLDFICPLQLQT